VPARGRRKRVWTVCLFFVAAWPLAAEEAQPSELITNPVVDELRVLVDSLHADNQRLKTDLEQRETVIRMLTENLALARTESEMFHKKWSEAQLRAQALGVNSADDSAAQAREQLAESVRALYLADAERQRLVAQVQRLIDALRNSGDVAGEVARTKALLDPARGTGSDHAGSGTGPGSLESATVLDVNPDLRLVVLNIGQAQGARVGMPMVVMRGERVIAELKVVEVRQRICGAVIDRVDHGITLKTGDVAHVARTS